MGRRVWFLHNTFFWLLSRSFFIYSCPAFWGILYLPLQSYWKYWGFCEKGKYQIFTALVKRWDCCPCAKMIGNSPKKSTPTYPPPATYRVRGANFAIHIISHNFCKCWSYYKHTSFPSSRKSCGLPRLWSSLWTAQEWYRIFVFFNQGHRPGKDMDFRSNVSTNVFHHQKKKTKRKGISKKVQGCGYEWILHENFQQLQHLSMIITYISREKIFLRWKLIWKTETQKT